MVGAQGFDVAIVLEKTIAIYKAKEDQSIPTLKTRAFTRHDSKAKLIEKASLYFAIAWIHTILTRPAIEKAPLILRIVMINNI